MLRLSPAAGLVLALSCCIQPLRAQLIELPLDEILGRSPLILEGRVLAQKSFWDNNRHNIYTQNTVRVTRIFKGVTSAPAEIQVITLGGIVDDRMELVSESVQYAPGDAGLFCLVPCVLDLPVSPAWENYGSPHGFFRYDLPGNTVAHPFHPFAGIAAFREQVRKYTGTAFLDLPGEQLEPVPGNRAVPVISSFSPTSTTAGTGATLTINGSNFGANPGVVRFLNSNSGGTFDADVADIVSWNDNQIVITVPSRSTSSGTAGTGTFQVRNSTNETGTSPSSLYVEYAYTNISYNGQKYGGKLVEDNGNGGMTFTLSTSLCSSSNQDAVNAIGRAMREWRCVTGVNWDFSGSTTSSTAIASDGVNIVTFDVSVPLTNGVIGRTTSRYTGCPGGTEWYVNEIDVNLDQATNWYYCDAATVPTGKIDFQSVVFHELGHGHQLGHIYNSSAVMYPSISSTVNKRTLNADEVNGANFIIGQAGNSCGPAPMALVPAQNCLNLTLPAACNSAGPCTAALPVELVSFQGTARAEGILIEWATASEWNNDHFTLERATDALHFESLREIPGEAASVQLRQYRHLDEQPFPGLNYYRLWQTDFDGSRHLLGMIAVAYGEKDNPVRVFPNPVSGSELFVQAENREAGTELELVLTDLPGRLIRRERIAEPSSGISTFSLDGLMPGTYLLLVYSPADRQLLQQLVVVKQ